MGCSVRRGENESATADGGSVFALALSPDGSEVASSGTGGIYRWDVKKQKMLQNLETQGASSDGNFLAYSPDGAYLATSSWTSVTLWPLK